MKKLLFLLFLLGLFGCTSQLTAEEYSVRIKWIGHAGFLVETQDSRIYINPYSAPIGSLKGDGIIISDTSLCELNGILLLRKASTIILAPAECVARLKLKNAIAVNDGTLYNIGDFKIISHKKENGYSYEIIARNKTIFYTGLNEDTINKKVDVVIFPLYNINDSISLIKSIESNYYIPMYYEELIGPTTDIGKELKSVAKDEGINITLINDKYFVLK